MSAGPDSDATFFGGLNSRIACGGGGPAGGFGVRDGTASAGGWPRGGPGICLPTRGAAAGLLLSAGGSSAGRRGRSILTRKLCNGNCSSPLRVKRASFYDVAGRDN